MLFEEKDELYNTGVGKMRSKAISSSVRPARRPVRCAICLPTSPAAN